MISQYVISAPFGKYLQIAMPYILCFLIVLIIVAEPKQPPNVEPNLILSPPTNAAAPKVHTLSSKGVCVDWEASEERGVVFLYIFASLPPQICLPGSTQAHWISLAHV